MVNTKCCQCLFANSSDDITKQCSKHILEQIKDIKNITYDDNGFPVIENYACRFGFSKQIYNDNRDMFTDEQFEALMTKNSTIRLYLILDIEHETDISKLSDNINRLKIKPAHVSFLFRDPSNKQLDEDTAKYLNENMKIQSWKAHSFLEPISLIDAIDHVLATNMRTNNTTHFLVYRSTDTELLSSRIEHINNMVVLYQRPHIAMIADKQSLYNLAISFENYKVAKSLNNNFFDAIIEESDILYY